MTNRNPPNRPKTPKSLRALVLNAAFAGFAFTAGAWLYFYVERIPVSRWLVSEHVSAKPGRAMLVGGLAPGPLLSVNLRTEGRLRLSVDKAAKILDPTPERLAAAPLIGPSGGPADQSVLDLYNSGTGNAGVDFEIQGTGRMAVELIPIPTENGRNGFRIIPRGGTLLAHALMIPGSDGKGGEMSLIAAGQSTAWDEATIAIPDGVPTNILADDPVGGGKRSTVVELPIHSASDPVISGTLPAGSLAIGDPASGAFDDIFCAAARPGVKRFWPIVFPEITLDGCEPGKLVLSALDPFGQTTLDTRGPAFVIRDGKPQYWEGLSLLIANPLISAALKGAIVAPFLLWAGLAFKALFKALRKR